MESAAYSEGREAYSNDAELSDNPYPKGEQEYADWQRGFEYAQRNDPLADLV